MKFGNNPTISQGFVFDSGAEAKRYTELRNLEIAGEIAGLVVHPVYDIFDAFTHPTSGRQRKVTYEADFSYHENGRKIVEDIKGKKTAAFMLKKKLFLARFMDVDFRIITKKERPDLFRSERRRRRW